MSGFRRAARVDDNQKEIIQEFRLHGASVKVVSQLKEFVDIVVGYRGYNFLFEIKDGSKPPSARRLTPGEEEFFATWRGSANVIESKDQVGPFLKSVAKTYPKRSF